MTHIRNAVTAAAKRALMMHVGRVVDEFSLTQTETNACLAELQLSLLMFQLHEERREGSE